MLFVSGIFFNIFGYSDDGATLKTGMVPFGPKPLITYGTSYLGYALAGLLVGFGTKLSNGCTSGHGLCGMARLSVRSFVAVGVFLLTAIGIATLGYYHTLGPFSEYTISPPSPDINNYVTANVFMAIGILLPVVGYFLADKGPSFSLGGYLKEYIIVFMVGLIFGLGLMISGMTRRLKIMRFLQIGEDWDPSLLFVLGCGCAINLLTFNYMIRIRYSFD